MKWFSILVLGALALFVNACEPHPAAELPPEHATAFGEHAWPPRAEAKHGAEAAPVAAPHAPAAAASAEGPAGEAPKFFPDKK